MNPLTTESTQEAGEFRHRISLSRPVFRGEVVDLRLKWTSPDMVRQEGGAWVFTGGGSWRKGLGPYQAHTRFPKGTRSSAHLDTSSTLALPEGASFESASPTPISRWMQNARMTMLYDDPNRLPKEQTLAVTYRLPEGTTPSE